MDSKSSSEPGGIVVGYDGSESADAAVDWAATEAERQGVAQLHQELMVETLAEKGSPARVLAQAATGAGLIVVGSHGRGAFPGLLLGSVSHAVLRITPCPVLVVR